MTYKGWYAIKQRNQTKPMAAIVSFGGDHRLEVFTPSSLCVWNQMLWRNLQIIVLPQVILHKPILKFVGLSEFVMLRIDFSENHFGSFKEFSEKLVRCIEQSIVNLTCYGNKGLPH